jgi:hypothetical protein
MNSPDSPQTCIQLDCLQFLHLMPDDSFDLVFCSPPYEAARTYGIGFDLSGQAWVDWAVKRYLECVRVCRGLVAWVVEGQTKKFRWSAVPAILMTDLHRAGVRLRKPPVFHRVGIPGSGGPDWWRNDYEFIVCASKGRLPWSDNSATGGVPKYGPGGAMSHRLKDGRKKHNPGRRADGKTEDQTYVAPVKANPGNVIRCSVGGGRMGSILAHENEAPFPEKLAESFILSFCPPNGLVLDPFCGSGTTLAVAKHHARRAVGVDVRESQIELTLRRLAAIGQSNPGTP